jgi:DNA mismatch endonuclease (patch repair protein)
MMRAFKSRDTAPELAVRGLAHRMGYRFRLHRKDLPGTPDLVFVSLRKVIFIHGCFWHSHGCKLTRLPSSNLDYWLPKLRRNRDRDARNAQELAAAGWEHLIIWECQIRDNERLKHLLRRFLASPS